MSECDRAHKVISRSDAHDDTQSNKSIRIKINQTYFHPVISSSNEENYVFRRRRKKIAILMSSSGDVLSAITHTRTHTNAQLRQKEKRNTNNNCSPQSNRMTCIESSIIENEI